MCSTRQQVAQCTGVMVPPTCLQNKLLSHSLELGDVTYANPAAPSSNYLMTPKVYMMDGRQADGSKHANPNVGETREMRRWCLRRRRKQFARMGVADHEPKECFHIPASWPPKSTRVLLEVKVKYEGVV
ncbi:hypothetical protein CDAR_29681 [Caerostris darwini]|uniref:Uncharacterized protein n=1 Tax=Caerostris darwini TaxID=1538125 RepID=A0AAV4QP84_9ARAC|nr:hypothetical protein CDAR_29681 [Caerostris darwini]